MSEFEKEHQYIVTLFKRAYDSNTLHQAQRIKRMFYDKYIILISPTDKNFLKLREELDNLEMEVTKKLTSLKLL
jgi:hypothetical protein